MNIQSLVGFTLEGCRFSKSSYTFEFSGPLNGQHVTLSVSTAFSVSVAGGAKADICEEFSGVVWPMLEQQLVRVEVDEATFEARFDFGEGRGFSVWSSAPPMDNLLLVTERGSGEWFTVL